MEWQGWFTLATLALVLVTIAREFATPDIAMGAGLLVLGVGGVLPPEDLFLGFANPVVFAIGGLLIVSSGLRESGAVEWVFHHLMGRASSERAGTLRLGPILAFGSAFLNNVTLVALSTPLLREWARRRGLAPSRMLIPMDYATILGSVTTLIGTSTTLVVAALIIDAGLPPMDFFELAPVGVPICLAGLVFLLLVAPRVLPDRRDPVDEVEDSARQYTASMFVEPGSPLVGQSIEEAGLRHLPGLFLVEIDRGGRIVTPVAPDQALEANDRLVFAGVVSTIVDLQRIRGLVPATETDSAPPPGADRRLVEAVISDSSPLVGRSIRDANFRTVYDAAVIAVHRGGERVDGKIGTIVLRPGDTLLLQCAPGFLRVHRNSPGFYLVSEIADGGGNGSDRSVAASAILAAMVLSVITGLLPISLAAPAAAGLMVLTGCLPLRSARASVNWSILIVIGAGLGIASAMESTGAAQSLGTLLVSAAGDSGPVVALAAVYLVTLLTAEFLNHTAAAAIAVPIAIAAAHQLGVDPRGFVMAVAFGASCSFAIPVSYQTHLIVYGPGGYRFTDFMRVGIALDVLCAVIAISLIPLVWPFVR